MILGATFLPNPANTLESWWRNCRALVANSQPRQRYKDIEEVQIARMGSVHAGCPLFPLHLYPSDTTRERPTRAGDRAVATKIMTQLFPLCRGDRLGASREWSGLIQG